MVPKIAETTPTVALTRVLLSQGGYYTAMEWNGMEEPYLCKHPEGPQWKQHVVLFFFPFSKHSLEAVKVSSQVSMSHYRCSTQII